MFLHRLKLFVTCGVFSVCRVVINAGSLVIWYLPARMRHLTEVFKGIHSYPGALRDGQSQYWMLACKVLSEQA